MRTGRWDRSGSAGRRSSAARYHGGRRTTAAQELPGDRPPGGTIVVVAVPDVEEPTFGANSWLVEEMYEQFVPIPSSVSESWQEFFADYRSMTDGDGRPRRARAADGRRRSAAQPAARRRQRRSASTACGTGRRPRPPLAAAGGTAAAPAPRRRRPTEPGKPIRGAGAAIAANMERSLDGPDRHQLPQRAGQAARGQPQGDQRLSASARATARSASPTSSATPSCGRSPTRCRR